MDSFLLTAAMLLAVTAGTVAIAPAAPASAASGLPRAAAQKLTTLGSSKVARVSPSTRSSRLATIPQFRPITGVRTVLPVLGERTTRGLTWLRVRLPGRPNGRTGWITKRGTVASTTAWRLVIRTASRKVRVYRRGHLVRTISAIVGKSATPTPQGRFFVEESVRMTPGSAGTPFALALSARSNVLQEFAGGSGQIAIHGVGNIGGTAGTAVSHGCVRLQDAGIRWLAARIGPGVPVHVTR